MKHRFSMKEHIWTNTVVYICILAIFAIVTFGGVCALTFWKDDTGYFFITLHNILYPIMWIHPATPLEFLINVKLFGFVMPYWHLVGIILKIIASYAIFCMVESITENQRVGFIAGFLSSVTVIGMEAVAWPSAHVVLWIMIGVSYSIHFFLQWQKTGKLLYGYASIGAMVCSLIADPGRVFPMLPLFFMVGKLSGWKKHLHTYRYAIAGSIGLVGISMLGVCIHSDISTQHPMTRAFLFACTHPEIIMTKLYVIANYFQSMAVMFVGWAFWFPETNATIAPNRLIAWCGVVGSIGSFLYLIISWKRYKKSVRIMLFFLAWSFLAYIPNWLFEPRLVSGITNHYDAVSGIGVIGLIAYDIGTIEKRTVRTILFICVMSLQWWYAYGEIGRMQKERLDARVQFILDRMSSDMSQDAMPKILTVTGIHPITASLHYSLPVSLGVYRDATVPTDFFLMAKTNAKETTEAYVCQKPVIHMFGKDVQYDRPVAVDHMYAWFIKNDGMPINQSEAFREEIEKEKRVLCPTLE